jgi:hypothetical protein
LFFKVELLSGSAVVNLDKIESPFVEEKVGVLMFKSIKTNPNSVFISIPKRTACVGSRFRVRRLRTG